MWKVSISIKIIRVEGIDPSNLVTLIYAGEDSAEELSPYNIDKAYELPQRNTCRITLKSSLTGLTLSVTLIPILLHLCNSIRGGLLNILASSRAVGEPAPTTKTVAKFFRIGIKSSCRVGQTFMMD